MSMKTYINGHCIEQVLTNAVELTTAQYNALPAAQKNVGTYIITDAEAPNISASNVSYDMGEGITTDVQTVLENLDNNKFDKIGGNISNDVVINKVHTSTSNQSSILTLGNNIASGSTGTSRGILQIYGTGSNYVNITANSITGDRSLVIPDETGTVITDYSTSGNGSFEVEVADNSWVKWIKVGKVVWVSCVFTVTGTITNQSYIVSNLPKPKLVDDFNFVFLFGGDGTSYRIQLIVASTGASGQLKNYYGRHVPQNVGLNGTFMYIAE